MMGGYDDYKAGKGTVMVTFEGNGYTAESDVVRMWHRRAAEVCGGAERYVVVDSKASSDTYQGASTTTTNMTFNGNQAHATTTTQPGMTWTKHALQGLVRCVAPESVPEPQSKASVTVTNPAPAPAATWKPAPSPAVGSAVPLGF
jgi:hypothetical protein